MATLPFSCCLIVLGLVGSTVQGRREFIDSRTDVQAQPEQPAGAPILLTLKLTNTSKETIHYRVDLGGVQYPSASWFKALITDGNGNTEEVKMSNDSHVDLLGSHIISHSSILPGQTITFPAVIHPWPAGLYTIQLNGQRARVTVKDDEQLAHAKTGAELRTLAGHTGDVIAVAFSPDGRWLASAGEDTTVVLWDAATGERRHKLRGHTSWVSSLSFSPDSRRLVSGSRDHTLKVWDMTRRDKVPER